MSVTLGKNQNFLHRSVFPACEWLVCDASMHGRRFPICLQFSAQFAGSCILWNNQPPPSTLGHLDGFTDMLLSKDMIWLKTLAGQQSHLFVILEIFALVWQFYDSVRFWLSLSWQDSFVLPHCLGYLERLGALWKCCAIVFFCGLYVTDYTSCAQLQIVAHPTIQQYQGWNWSGKSGSGFWLSIKRRTMLSMSAAAARRSLNPRPE